MRVIAGSARGRRLVTPAGDRVRPTSDRVREATFNALGSLDAVVDARVLDLFAGSGALGVEALSRGAADCVFVDAAPAALAAVRDNLATCGLADRARVVRGDARDWVATAAAEGPFDLVLLDPPYAFDDWEGLFLALVAVAPGAVLVVESDRPVAPPPGGIVLRERRYGGTVVTIIRTAGPAPHDPLSPEDGP